MQQTICKPSISLLVLAGLFSATCKSQDLDCFDVGLPEDRPAQLLRVTDPAARTHFVKSTSEQSGCPSAAADCQRKAYLVPGNEVVGVVTRDGFVCAGFAGANGRLTVGWLPQDKLQTVPSGKLVAKDWTGDWARDDEASLVIRQVSAERVEISGDASWGSHDPERVERGAVNVGQIEPTQADLGGEVLMIESGVGAIDPAQAVDGTCVLGLQRIGAVLLVRDNLACGGMNVSFSGLYIRQR